MHAQSNSTALRDWRLKALAFRVLEHMPLQRTAYTLLQRYVAAGSPRELSPTRESSASQQHHLRAFREHFGPIDEARLLSSGPAGTSPGTWSSGPWASTTRR